VFGDRKVVEMVERGSVDRARGDQRAAAERVDKGLTVIVDRDTDAIAGAKNMIDSTEIGIFRVRLRVEEREATDRIRHAVSLRKVLARPVVKSCTRSGSVRTRVFRG